MSEQNVISKLITLKNCQGYVFYKPEEIIHLQAEGNYTQVYITGQDKSLRILCQLSKLGAQLDSREFFKCHRSHIVNLRHLRVFIEKSRILELYNGHQVPISESYLKIFRKMIR